MKRLHILLTILTVLALSTVACLESTQLAEMQPTLDALVDRVDALSGDEPVHSPGPSHSGEDLGEPTVEFTLRTDSEGHNLVFRGVGGEIDGQANPLLVVQPGDIVQITIINGQPAEHDFVIDEFGVHSGSVRQMEERITVTFLADAEGSFEYYCSIIGHRAAGMFGTIQVGAGSAAAADAVSIIKHPADLPAPVGGRGPQLVQAELVAQEVIGQLAGGTAYPYFTFNGTVPGPFIRARVGDTVEITLRNETDSAFTHSVDLHAATGPGGGGEVTQVGPGETKVFTFQALNPGIYVYHCATPSVPHHIASGMYGLILIEPTGGLPPVDREFYVMQGEIYTTEPFGTPGLLSFSHEKMSIERPEYFVFNGAAGALATEENWLSANVGESVRIFLGVGGPNFTSSFHVIGEIFDRAYAFGSLTSPPLTDVQTISVPPGGAVMVEFTLNVPGHYVLVDHALSRLERGLVGILHAEGPQNPDIFRTGPANP
ncbi:MAG: nitrite reductase, copper-containing [Anaerolineales bacterium]|nr:nitrite reductase, copper-containing [Anaerolineales bacterium]